MGLAQTQKVKNFISVLWGCSVIYVLKWSEEA